METELQVGGNDEEVWFEISDDYHNGMQSADHSR